MGDGRVTVRAVCLRWQRGVVDGTRRPVLRAVALLVHLDSSVGVSDGRMRHPHTALCFANVCYRFYNKSYNPANCYPLINKPLTE
jgi:hypothetical protein